MSQQLRQKIAEAADTIVVKVGTRVLTRDDGMLHRERIAQIAEQLHGLMEIGRRVVLVSSGAVGAGMHRLGLSQRPSDLAKLQAVAAVGQSALVEAYPSPTDSRRLRPAAQLPQYSQYNLGFVGIWRRPHHQRKRHCVGR